MLAIDASPVTDLFDRIAGLYDAPALQAAVYRPPQDEILAELRRLGARTVVDVGCGTGILATRVSEEIEHSVVYGCDASEGMLDQARARGGTVTWLRGASERLPLPDGAVDAVVSSHAFHFFDQRAALAEARRVLAPGGHLVVVVVNPRTHAASRAARVGSMGTARFPTARAMRRMVVDAGFSAVTQHRVRRGPFRRLSPDVVTVAAR